MPSENSRTEILTRIRKTLPASADQTTIATEWNAIPRDFRTTADRDRQAILDLLIHRLHDYDAQVLETRHEQASEAVHKMLTARGVRRLLTPSGFPPNLLPEGFDYIHDEALGAAQIEACEGVITTCTLAIAETGTLVLQHGAGQGRRALTLVPDYHLCLVFADQIVATVPEAIRALQPTAALPTTFISGPSATADIEMTRIKGVHGPRFLDVVLVTQTAPELDVTAPS